MKASATLFDPVRSSRTSERVADAIRRLIVEGRVRPGETLPPERTLAERFRVTRNTVREALRALEHQRLVEIRQGSGIRVRDYRETAGLDLAATLLESAGSDLAAWMCDVAEARAVIGRAILCHAIDRLDERSIREVTAAIDAFVAEAGRSERDVQRLQALDFEIHNALVRCGGNRALLLLHNSLRHVYASVAHLFEPLFGRPDETAALYRKLATALEAGQRARAKRLVHLYFAAGRASLADGEGLGEVPR
jgi:DNA-binding FadR family transcriptional regulator